ncbi:MAG: hypothetical protein ACYS29_14895 [Planctomycetota bacterium]
MSNPNHNILFEWESPRELSVYTARQEMRRGLMSVLRIVVLTGSALRILYLVFVYLMPDEIPLPLGKVCVVLFVMAVLAHSVMHVVLFYLTLRSRERYQIDADGVRIIGHKYTDQLVWKDIAHYALDQDQKLPGIYLMTLRTWSRSESFCLPKDEREQRIIEYVRKRVSAATEEVLPHKEPRETSTCVLLTGLQKLFLFLSTIGYSLALAFCAAFTSWKLFAFYMIMFSIIVGPGTICMVVMFGRRLSKKDDLMGPLVLCNFAALTLAGLLMVILELWKMRRSVGGW